MDGSILKSIHAFSALDETMLESLAAFMSLRTIRAGETIFCQGEPSPYCFGVLSGEVMIQQVSKDLSVPSKIIGTISAGDLFGESAIFPDRVRLAMATASKDGKLVALRGIQLRQWIDKNPAVSQPLLETLSRPDAIT